MGISIGDQIKINDKNAEIVGFSKSEKGKFYYRVKGESEPRFFVAKNKQQVKEKGVVVTRPAVSRRPKQETVKTTKKKVNQLKSIPAFELPLRPDSGGVPDTFPPFPGAIREREATRTPRLLEAAKELNVGRETLVAYLEDKGFIVTNAPSFRLTSKMYEILQDEFKQNTPSQTLPRRDETPLPKGSLLEGLKKTQPQAVGLKDLQELADIKKAQEKIPPAIKPETTTIEAGFRRYELDTSEEAFKPYADKFGFKIGDQVTDRFRDLATILGTTDGKLFYRENRIGNGNEGYFDLDINEAIDRFPEYIKFTEEKETEDDVPVSERLAKNAKEAIDDFFNGIREGARREGWRWEISEDGKYISMNYSDPVNIPQENADEYRRELATKFASRDPETGIENLLSLLNGKRLIPLLANGRTYFKIIEGSLDNFKHKEALIAKADRLKNSDAFQALADIIANDPNLREEYNMVLARLNEFKKGHINPEERHRTYTAMLTAIMLSPRLARMFELVVDSTVEKESDDLKEKIRDGENYSYEVILGTGIHSTIYNIGRQMHFPNTPSLSADQNRKIGGQFAQFERDAFHLNSRTRPQQRGAEYLPGTAQTLNTFTEFATMQPSDTSGISYSYQTALARNTRTNFFLSGKAITQTELQRIRPTDTEGEIELEFLDKKTNKLMQVRTSRLVLGSGLGKELTRLNEEDSLTTRILAEEQGKYENGEDAQVMSFSQFVQQMSGHTNPFPQRGMKTVIMSGPGDSGNVIAGMLLGYETQYGKTTMQLDNVEKIIWLGQDIPTKEEFLQTVRTRYSQVGLEFPREQIEGYYARIQPVSARSEELRRNNGAIVVVDDNGIRHEGDHFIYAHGFEDKTDTIINSYYNREYRTPDGITQFVANEDIDDILDQGNEITYKEGSAINRMQILKTGTESAVIRLVKRDGSFTEQSIIYKQLKKDFFDQYLNPKNIQRILVNTNDNYASNALKPFYDTDSKNTSPIAKKYEAYQNKPSPNIYKIGPAARLSLTLEEIDKSPALQNISENTASVFRYAKYTEQVAHVLAKQDEKSPEAIEKIESSITNTEQGQKKQVREIEVFDKKRRMFSQKEKTSEFTYRWSTNKRDTDTLAYDENLNDILRLSIGTTFEEYKFGDETRTLELNISKRDNEVYSVALNTKVNSQFFIQELLENKLFMPAIERLTNRKNNRKEGITIRIPLSEGKVQTANITYTTN